MARSWQGEASPPSRVTSDPRRLGGDASPYHGVENEPCVSEFPADYRSAT